jgi:putative ABC transport system permease protein
MLPRGRQLINYEQQGFYTEHFAYAESTLFEVFDFQLIAGDTEGALAAPNTVVFSESMAKRTLPIN